MGRRWKLIVSSLFVLFLAEQALHAQISSDSRYYEFGIECAVYKCNIIGQIVDSSFLVAPTHSKFIVVDRLNDKYIIRFTLLPQEYSSIRKKYYSNEDMSMFSYFLINAEQLIFKASAITSARTDFIVGNVFTPLKLRLAPFDFAKDFGVGTTFGLKNNIGSKKPFSIDVLLGLGVSTLTIDSFSSNGHVDVSSDLVAFSPSLGLVMEFGNTQLGVFTGMDLMSSSNQKKYQWIYKNKPWLSFGIGFSLFSFKVKE